MWDSYASAMVNTSDAGFSSDHPPLWLGGVMLSTDRDRFTEMRRFYIELLGIAPRSDRPGFVNFDLDDCRLTIAQHDQVTGVNRDPARVMINFVVEDVLRRYRAALTAGAEAIRPPEREKWGGLVSTVRDPDGNYVQLIGRDPRRPEGRQS